MRRISTLLLVMLAQGALAQVTSVGPDLRDLQNARNVGMGGSFEALGYGTEAIIGNPAALSLYKRYQIEANGLWDIPQGFGTGSIALADSTNALAAGVSYNFSTFDEGGRRWAHLTTLALAYAFGDLVHIGLAGRHQVLIGASNTNSVTVNAGIVVRPISALTIGISGHNLIPVYNKDITRYFTASIAAQLFNQLTPSFDLRADFNQPTPRFAFHGGIEWLIAEAVPLRGGYEYDGIAGHHYVSGGLGYFNQGSGVDVAYRHEIGGKEGRMIALTLKLQL